MRKCVRFSKCPPAPALCDPAGPRFGWGGLRSRVVHMCACWFLFSALCKNETAGAAAPARRWRIFHSASCDEETVVNPPRNSQEILAVELKLLCQTSFSARPGVKNNSKKLYRGCRSSKNDFRQNSADYQFFSPARANFISNLGPVKTYKPKNPSGWHYLLDEPSQKMDSNPNSNGWNRI